MPTHSKSFETLTPREQKVLESLADGDPVATNVNVRNQGESRAGQEGTPAVHDHQPADAQAAGGAGLAERRSVYRRPSE